MAPVSSAELAGEAIDDCPKTVTPIAGAFQSGGVTHEWGVVTAEVRARRVDVVMESRTVDDRFAGSWSGQQIDFRTRDEGGHCETTYSWRKVTGHFSVAVARGGATQLGTGSYACDFELITVVRNGELIIVKDVGTGPGSYLHEGVVPFGGQARWCGVRTHDWNAPSWVETGWISGESGGLEPPALDETESEAPKDLVAEFVGASATTWLVFSGGYT